MSGRRIGVVGAGIAGTAFALAAARSGLQPTLYERRAAAASEGGGLLLWTNGMLALERIHPGVARAVRRRGAVIHGLAFEDHGGAPLLEVSLERFAQRFGAPTVFLPRAELTAALLAALPIGAVKWSTECRRFTEGSAGAVIVCADGRRSPRYDAVVGADGVHSAVRRQIQGDQRLRSAHQVLWLGEADARRFRARLESGVVRAVVGRGVRFCACAVGDDLSPRAGTIFWYATEKVSRASSSGGEESMLTPEELAALFEGSSLPAAEIILASTQPRPFPLSDRAPHACWSTRHAVLVGDAAHLATPDLGQGACQALEDAVVLAEELGRDASVPGAIERYVHRRFTRAARITQNSRATALLSMVTTPGADLVRPLGIRAMSPLVEQDLSYLLGAADLGASPTSGAGSLLGLGSGLHR